MPQNAYGEHYDEPMTDDGEHNNAVNEAARKKNMSALPTNDQIIELLKPALEQLSPTRSGSVYVELSYGNKTIYELSLRAWDSANGRYHHGETFEEIGRVKASFDPMELKKLELSEAEQKISKLRAEIEAEMKGK